MLLQFKNDLLMAMIVVNILVAIIIFFVGVLVTKLWAGKKGWDDDLKPALFLNLFWLVINILLGLYLFGIIALLINIIVGGWVACKLYDKSDYKDGLIFVIIVLIILFILLIIISVTIRPVIVEALMQTAAY